MKWWKRRTSEATKARVEEEAAAADQELAVVKAAASAWYHHRSGNDGRAVQESEFGRRRLTGATPLSHGRPSRYNLEAATAGSGSASASAPVTTLLDVYEVERITREMERLFLATTDQSPSNSSSSKVDERRRKVATAGRFWGRHGVAICGAKGSVVEGAILVGRRGPGKEEAAAAEVVVNRKVQ